MSAVNQGRGGAGGDTVEGYSPSNKSSIAWNNVFDNVE